MAPQSSILAWKIPWAEDPGRLLSMGSLRVEHDWATSLSFFTFMHWRRKCTCSCLENPRDGGAWWAAVYGVAQSWTRLKWLSSSILTSIHHYNSKCNWVAALIFFSTCSSLPFSNHPLPLASTDHFTVSVVLPFLGCYILGITGCSLFRSTSFT